MGDTPYSDREETKFLDMMARMDREPLAFVVHVGDFKGTGRCSDELFQRRKEQFDRSAHPLIYTPGDNEWTDCRREHMGAEDPIEKLARLRQVFFADGWSLGREKLATEYSRECVERSGATCTCPALPENRRWLRSGVVFATLNVPGSSNNVGYDARNDEEARCRNAANRQWLEQAVREGERPDRRALVVLIQANPWVTDMHVYEPLLRQLEESARGLRKPLLFVHGDTHIYRVDQPFRNPDGQPIPNLTRMETYGSPVVGWVKVTVDPGKPDLFSFAPKIVAVVPP
jgi:hypothetical protein